jgi:hypothetical protein
MKGSGVRVPASALGFRAVVIRAVNRHARGPVGPPNHCPSAHAKGNAAGVTAFGVEEKCAASDVLPTALGDVHEIRTSQAVSALAN